MAQLEKEKFDHLMAFWSGLDFKDLALEFKRLQDEYNAAKEVSALVYAEFEVLRKNVIPRKMEDAGIETIKITGVGRLQIGTQVSAKQLDKGALFEWLEENGHSALVAESVNASTLGSFIKTQIANGDPIPDPEIVDFSTYEVASVVKA